MAKEGQGGFETANSQQPIFHPQIPQMKIIFYIGHPAHYHNVSHVATELARRSHDVLLVVRQKDVVLDLVSNLTLPKVILPTKYHHGRLSSRVLSVLSRELRMLLCALKFQPKLLIGTDLVLTHVAKLLNIASVFLTEDDSAQVPLYAKYGFPYASTILAPQSCDITPYRDKRIAYNGFHELAYLHPNYFKPDFCKVTHLISPGERVFVVRFAELSAHHDNGRKGISTEVATRIIHILEGRGRVFITAERELEPQFEKYRLKINPIDMHHLLYYADLYIGDSQTMAAEAAVLGTPSLRFNDFVGKLGYLEELEHEYGLTYGFKTTQPEKLYAKIEELLKLPDLKQRWQERRKRMLAEKIDVCAFWVWFFENYPDSIDIMKEQPDYQFRFK